MPPLAAPGEALSPFATGVELGARVDHRMQELVELRQADACTHGVQIYGDLDDLARSVAAFLSAGFDAGEPGLVVATPEHLDRFEAGSARPAAISGRCDATAFCTSRTPRRCSSGSSWTAPRPPRRPRS